MTCYTRQMTWGSLSSLTGMADAQLQLLWKRCEATFSATTCRAVLSRPSWRRDKAELLPRATPGLLVSVFYPLILRACHLSRAYL